MITDLNPTIQRVVVVLLLVARAGSGLRPRSISEPQIFGTRRAELVGKSRRREAFMSSLYDVSCFAAGLAGNLLSSSFLCFLLPSSLLVVAEGEKHPGGGLGFRAGGGEGFIGGVGEVACVPRRHGCRGGRS